MLNQANRRTITNNATRMTAADRWGRYFLETTNALTRRKLPIGIQTFSEIIEEGYCYVDKSGFAVSLPGMPKFSKASHNMVGLEVGTLLKT